jgi:hypothetical protein
MKGDVYEYMLGKRLGDVVEFLDNQRRPVTESDRIEGPYPYMVPMVTLRPNAAHVALAEIEKKLGHLCTQNVDDLHERAGSRRVHHMHGTLFQSRAKEFFQANCFPQCRETSGVHFIAQND